MRRSPYLAISLLAVCALSVAGCQRAGPADPQSPEASASNPDVIDAVPLAPDAAPQPQPVAVITFANTSDSGAGVFGSQACRLPIVTPPSTTRWVPVTKLEVSEAR